MPVEGDTSFQTLKNSLRPNNNTADATFAIEVPLF